MYEFSEEKIKLLIDANEKLNICDDLNVEKNKNLIFVYCPPKVGSTTLITSFRLCALRKFTILHIHDESMLKVLCGIEGVTVNEIIFYNKALGKNVYVIDIYRSPIEQKMSAFFEKIGSFHFNNTNENVNTYDVNKLIKRFNKIFPYLSRFDYYREIYNIPVPEVFDFEKKYLNIEYNGIYYIKIRLKDSKIWSSIFQEIFGINILIVNDYETDKKIIKDMYFQFKNSYRIPCNLLSIIQNCDTLKYYYSPDERNQYLNSWYPKQEQPFISYSESEYNLYIELCIENQHIGEIQRQHYIDVGCTCVGCSRKRNQILYKISNGHEVADTIDHTQSNNEYKNMIIQKKKERLNQIIQQVAIVNSINNNRNIKKPKSIIKKSFNMVVK